MTFQLGLCCRRFFQDPDRRCTKNWRAQVSCAARAWAACAAASAARNWAAAPLLCLAVPNTGWFSKSPCPGLLLQHNMPTYTTLCFFLIYLIIIINIPLLISERYWIFKTRNLGSSDCCRQAVWWKCYWNAFSSMKTSKSITKAIS